MNEEHKIEEGTNHQKPYKIEGVDGPIDENNLNNEFKKRLIENNLELMNGVTIQVTTDKDYIPDYFIPLENLEAMKAAVSMDMDQSNIGAILGKRKEREEPYDEEHLNNLARFQSI